MDRAKVKKVVKTGAGVVIMGAGVAAKLTEMGLSVCEVVLNGAENLASSFVEAPKLGIGKSLFGAVKKGTANASKYLLKKGKELTK